MGDAMNPKLYTTDAAWASIDLADKRWIYVLESDELRELYRAAKSLPDDESAWLDLTRDYFDLPKLNRYSTVLPKNWSEVGVFACCVALSCVEIVILPTESIGYWH